MGKAQSVALKPNTEMWSMIEKSLNNKNLPLDVKLFDEYQKLKRTVTTNSKTTASSSLHSYKVSNKTLMNRFVKWYKMAFRADNVDEEISKKLNSLHTISIPKQHGHNSNSNMSHRLDIQSPNKIASEEVDMSVTISNVNSNKIIPYQNRKNTSGVSSINFHLLNLDLEKGSSKKSPDRRRNSNNVEMFNKKKSPIKRISAFKIINPAEIGLREYYTKNKEKFVDRVSKGPPESFRWVSWLILQHVPEEKSEGIFITYFRKELSEEINTQIKKDLNRTLTEEQQSLNIPETQELLYKILKAFASVDKQVSYCQGMNFIAGFLLLISDFNELESFYMMVSLFSNENNKVNQDTFGLRGFFLDNFPLLKLYLYYFDYFFIKKLPNLKAHFTKLEIPDEVWIAKWFQTLFVIVLPANSVIRLWDCIMAYGLEFLLNFTLSLLKHFEYDLLKCPDTYDIVEYFRGINTHFIDIEEILINAKKIFISKNQVFYLKHEYEHKHKLNLDNEMCIKYKLNENYEKMLTEEEFNDIILDSSFDEEHISLFSPSNIPLKTVSDGHTDTISNLPPTKSNSNNVNEPQKDDKLSINNVSITMNNNDNSIWDDINNSICSEQGDISESINSHTFKVKIKNKFNNVNKDHMILDEKIKNDNLLVHRIEYKK